MLDQLVAALPLVMRGAYLTILVTTVAITAGLIGGFICGFISCEKIKLKGLSQIIFVLEFIINGTPVFVQLLIVYFVLPHSLGIDISPAVAGMITLGLNAVTRFTEIIRHDIDHIPDGQWEACKVLGYPLHLILLSVIFPQILRSSLASFISETITILKETYIISILGAVELTKVAMSLGSKDLDPLTSYLFIACVYLVIIGALTYLVTIAENKFLKADAQQSS